jgi:hypothetical protein
MTTTNESIREVTIDGRSYRWWLRYEDLFPRADIDRRVVVVVNDLATPRGPLHLHLPPLPCDDWVKSPAYLVMPRDLARWITHAVAAGWVPKKRRRPPFHLQLLERDLEVLRIMRLQRGLRE